jgi:type II restriction enzyme
MNLKFDLSIAERFKSNSQIARVLTEAWVKKNSYCPSCGNSPIDSFPNNSPVADFLCNECKSEFELKSNAGKVGVKIIDGAYRTMIERINSNNNPHFFFLSYSKQTLEVSNFLVIPKYYFVNDIIEERKPLALSARRAGWIGCNIILTSIPASGKIYLVRDGKLENRKLVLETWAKTSFLNQQKNESRGWTIETLKILDLIPSPDFTLQDVYHFELRLKSRFPNNNFVRDKIRQQLQILRDKGLLEFKGNGAYKKLN